VITVGYDNAADYVSCGAGWDVVILGPTDAVTTDCERRVRVSN
jgi:hypothetical protein